jgi:hypothetical protein
MSGSIEKLTAAIEANTAVQEKVLAALKGGASAGGAKASAAKEDKPADKPKASGAKGGGKKKTTVDDIAAAFGGYLGIKDKDEREERKANVKAIVDYFGVAKATEIDPDNFDEALKYLQQYIDGETPDFDGGDGDEGGDDEALV